MSRPRLPSKELRELAREARAEGWEVSFTGSGHVRFSRPGCGQVIASATPRKGGYPRTRAQLRRSLGQSRAPP